MKQTMSFIFCGTAPDVYGHATNTFKQIFIAWADVKSKGDPKHVSNSMGIFLV